MKLVLREVTRQRELKLDLETLAVSYGLVLPVAATLEGTQEVQDVGHDNALD